MFGLLKTIQANRRRRTVYARLLNNLENKQLLATAERPVKLGENAGY